MLYQGLILHTALVGMVGLEVITPQDLLARRTEVMAEEVLGLTAFLLTEAQEVQALSSSVIQFMIPSI